MNYVAKFNDNLYISPWENLLELLHHMDTQGLYSSVSMMMMIIAKHWQLIKMSKFYVFFLLIFLLLNVGEFDVSHIFSSLFSYQFAWHSAACIFARYQMWMTSLLKHGAALRIEIGKRFLSIREKMQFFFLLKKHR